jgi:hypothetical protein
MTGDGKVPSPDFFIQGSSGWTPNCLYAVSGMGIGKSENVIHFACLSNILKGIVSGNHHIESTLITEYSIVPIVFWIHLYRRI